jgi:hypothetical protein
MNDKEKLVKLLTEFGIPFTDHESSVYIEAGPHPNCVGGYSGFFTEFDFNPDGSFKEMAIAE